MAENGSIPARGRIAELRLEDMVVGHGQEAQVHLALLAPADAIYCRPRSAWPRTRGGPRLTVLGVPFRRAAENAEAMPVGVGQHLVGLQPIGADQEGAAKR